MARLMFWKQPSLPHETCDRCPQKATQRVSVTVQSEPREMDWSLRCSDHLPKDQNDPNEWRRSLDLYIDAFLKPYGLKPPFG